MQSANTTKHKIENTIIDLQFLQKILKEPKEQNYLAPQSIDDFIKMIRFKNSRYSFTKKFKQKSQEWMYREGIPIYTMVDKINAKVSKVQKPKSSIRKHENEFYGN